MERTAEEAWPDFRGWRVNYEQTALALAESHRCYAGTVDGRPCRRPDDRHKRPVDRTPGRTRGTQYTQPGTYETS